MWHAITKMSGRSRSPLGQDDTHMTWDVRMCAQEEAAASKKAADKAAEKQRQVRLLVRVLWRAITKMSGRSRPPAWVR